jgi:hypothetical protein
VEGMEGGKCEGGKRFVLNSTSYEGPSPWMGFYFLADCRDRWAF